MKKSILGLILTSIILVSAFTTWYLGKRTISDDQLPTFFEYYSEELSRLEGKHSNQEIYLEDIYTWDTRAFSRVETTRTNT
jgi:hypothetical protein